MRVGYIIYNDTTECEFISVNEILGKVHQLDFPNPPQNVVIGVTPRVIGWNGVVIEPHVTFDKANISDYDLLVVPGGQASRTVRYNTAFIQWLGQWPRDKTIASCCSGALILAQAGLLSGKRATCHSLAFPTLAEYPDIKVVKQRVVEDGNTITSGGIFASIDLGLYLVEKFWGAEARRAIAHQNEYRDCEALRVQDRKACGDDAWYDGGHLPVHKRPADALAGILDEASQ